MNTIFNQIKRFQGGSFKEGESFEFVLNPECSQPAAKNAPVRVSIDCVDNTEYEITVKPYMTNQATPSFDFMRQWNNDIPMPMLTMRGVKVKETRGMVYMNLHGVSEPTIHCRRCNRVLTNEVSKQYGIGPECMSKIGIVSNIADITHIRKRLTELTWSGWIIKSAITSQKPV